MGRVLRRVMALAVLLPLKIATLSAQSPTSTSVPYEDLVDAYRRGEHQEAVAELLSWPEQRVEKGVHTFSEGGRRRPIFKAAVMLHTDVALIARARQQDEIARRHYAFARKIVDKLPKDSTFPRRWLLAMGIYHSTFFEPQTAVDCLQHALDATPNDPELLLALGTTAELTRFGGAPTGSRGSSSEGAISSGQMRDALGHAERRLRRALAADPHLDEARLRLGDVLLVLGRPKEAAAEIEAVLAKSADPDLLCPAHLFLGGMHEQAGRLADAIKSYRDALDLDPTGQTPNLALSAALDASGDAAGARDALERALAEAGDAHELAHPWWVFQLGQSKRLDALLEALREESAS